MNGIIIVSLCFCTYGALCADLSSDSETPSDHTEPPPESRCSCESEKYDANKDFQYYILKGKPTQPHAYPSVVSLRYHSEEICGGTIINQCFILTAAHCVDEDLSPDNYDIVVGLHDLASLHGENTKTDTNVKIVKVKGIKHYPTYDKLTMEHNIAILELAEPITYNSDVKPTYLASVIRNYDYAVGTAVGWGKTEDCTSTSCPLQDVDMNIISIYDCKRLALEKRRVISVNNICTSSLNTGKSPDEGDSGGPLFVHGEQVGIISGDDKMRDSAVYTKVPAYMDFIYKEIQVLADCKVYTKKI